MILLTDEQTATWFPNSKLEDRERCLNAADRHVWNKVTLTGTDAVTTPHDVVEAVHLLTSRYLARINSPEGVSGMDEMALQITPMDRDVLSLIAPYRAVVFG